MRFPRRRSARPLVPALLTIACMSTVVSSCHDELSAPQTDIPQPSFNISTGSPGSWASRTSMPIARAGMGSGVIRNASGQDIMYVVGGQTLSSDALSRMDSYNASTKAWTRRADLPAARMLPGVAALNGKLYVVNGLTPRSQTGVQSPTKTLYAYTPSTNSWTRKADMPVATYAGEVAAIGRYLYVVTGFLPALTPGPARLYRYNPATNSWTERARPPQACGVCAGGVINGKLYLLGYQSVNMYDPAANQWKTVHNMEEADWSPYADSPFRNSSNDGVTLNQQLYVIGGSSGEGYSRTVFAYNPVTNSWSKKADMIRRRLWHTVGKVKDGAGVLQIIATGGWSDGSPSIIRQTEAFTP